MHTSRSPDWCDRGLLEESDAIWFGVRPDAASASGRVNVSRVSKSTTMRVPLKSAAGQFTSGSQVKLWRPEVLPPTSRSWSPSVAYAAEWIAGRSSPTQSTSSISTRKGTPPATMGEIVSVWFWVNAGAVMASVAIATANPDLCFMTFSWM